PQQLNYRTVLETLQKSGNYINDGNTSSQLVELMMDIVFCLDILFTALDNIGQEIMWQSSL
ncbi:MAG: hypothetical protein WCA79_19800, partial [Anaerolineales bacterium]